MKKGSAFKQSISEPKRLCGVCGEELLIRSAIGEMPGSEGRYICSNCDLVVHNAVAVSRNIELDEKGRASDPNDRGYGDQMVQRKTGTSIEDIMRSRSQDTAPQNMFSSKKVSEGAFNARFEQEVKSRRQTGPGKLMERNDDPLAWNGGMSSTGGGYSEVAIFDGMMVDRGAEDFTKMSGESLGYSDYMSGFNTFSEQLPEEHAYNKSLDVKKAYNERLSQLSQIPERGHSRSFKESESLMEQRRKTDWDQQQQRNKTHVLQYRDQYTSEDLLPPPRVAPGGMPVDKPSSMSRNTPNRGGGGTGSRGGGTMSVTERPRPGGPRNHSNSGGRETVALPDPAAASFRPATSSSASQPAGPTGSAINDRMMDRMMDNVRGPPRNNW